jgi:RimJ/RimL family protein N-acetyltransferase
MIQLIEVDYSHLAGYRRTYLDSLPCLQEIYLELLNCDADYFQIESDSEIIGYAIVSKEKTLLELKAMIESQSVFNFYEGETLVGSGFFNRIHEDFNGYDLGVWVDEPYRRKGIASRIISYLNQRCLQIGGKPCLGCAVDNYLSQKTIEKNGFISKYRLLEFEVH